MNNIHSFLAFRLETFWQKHAAHMVFLFALALSLLTFAISKVPAHIPHSIILADAGSTPLPSNLGGGGPWH